MPGAHMASHTEVYTQSMYLLYLRRLEEIPGITSHMQLHAAARSPDKTKMHMGRGLLGIWSAWHLRLVPCLPSLRMFSHTEWAMARGGIAY